MSWNFDVKMGVDHYHQLMPYHEMKFHSMSLDADVYFWVIATAGCECRFLGCRKP